MEKLSDKMHLSVETILHATEDWGAVKKALEDLFNIQFSETNAQGHWDNPILLLSAEIEDEALAKKIAKSVRVDDFASRSDKGAFYLRLSKDAIMDGEFKQGSDIRIIFHVSGSAKAVEKKVREFWGNA